MKTYLLKLTLVLAIVFAPIQATLMAVFALAFCDLLTGLAASLKTGEKLQSSGLRRTIAKILVYELVVMLGFITEQYLTGDVIPLTKVLAGFIGITELKSCLENLELITGMPILKLLINRLTNLDK